jgi:ActR/RegA family two-component response regulator
MSGDLGSYTAERLRKLGAAAVLSKPFHLDEVAQALWELATNGNPSPASPVNVDRQREGRGNETRGAGHVHQL